MKPFVWIALLLAFTSCSFQNRAQRINVDYNKTIEGITNELTLLNILRAKEGMPLHYTSVQRLSGSITLKAAAGFNAQIKANIPTDTTSTTTAVAPAGTTLTDVVSRAVLSGGHIYMPSIGTEVNTGPSFDVSILDSQAFYQGILASVPVATVNNFLLQGFDSKRLISLLAARIELRLKKDKPPGFSKPKGALLSTLSNDDEDRTDDSFTKFIACYTFSGANAKPADTAIAPMSRVTDTRERRSLTMQDLALLDGAKLVLSGPISDDPSHDRTIMVMRPAEKQHVLQLSRASTCPDQEQIINGKAVTLSPEPPAESPYVGSGQVEVLADDRSRTILVDADIAVIFRSPEGVIQFLGRCLQTAQAQDGRILCKAGDEVLFALRQGSAPDALISSRVLGERYYVANDEYRRATMEVIALIERLINLQKSATDRPVTIPVQVVP